MGAGYCQWGGFTDRNVCNIHGEEHLTSRYRAILRILKIRSLGPLGAAGERVTHARKEGKLGNIWWFLVSVNRYFYCDMHLCSWMNHQSDIQTKILINATVYIRCVASRTPVFCQFFTHRHRKTSKLSFIDIGCSTFSESLDCFWQIKKHGSSK